MVKLRLSSLRFLSGQEGDATKSPMLSERLVIGGDLAMMLQSLHAKREAGYRRGLSSDATKSPMLSERLVYRRGLSSDGKKQSLATVKLQVVGGHQCRDCQPNRQISAVVT